MYYFGVESSDPYKVAFPTAYTYIPNLTLGTTGSIG